MQWLALVHVYRGRIIHDMYRYLRNGSHSCMCTKKDAYMSCIGVHAMAHTCACVQRKKQALELQQSLKGQNVKELRK
jgi:hypothetical protein